MVNLYMAAEPGILRDLGEGEGVGEEPNHTTRRPGSRYVNPSILSAFTTDRSHRGLYPLISIFPSVLSGYITSSIGTNDIDTLSVLNQVLRRISGKDKQHIFNVEVA